MTPAIIYADYMAREKEAGELAQLTDAKAEAIIAEMAKDYGMSREDLGQMLRDGIAMAGGG